MHRSIQMNRQVEDERQIQRAPTRKEVARKMTLLRYELNSLSDKIGKARDQDVSFASQKQYEAKQREFNFLKDLKRRSLSISVENNKNAVDNLSSKIGQKPFSLNHREQQVLGQESSSKKRLSHIGPQISSNIKSNMQEKFIEFCKNKSSVPPYFSEVVPQSKVMKYKCFLYFMKQAGLEEVLSFEERMRIFNRHSKFKKRLLFEQFYVAMQDCCKIICERHQTRFSQHNFRSFLTKILAKLQISFITPKNHSIKKLQMHTGLFKQSIGDILADGRKLFDEKRAKSIQLRKKLIARIKQPFPIINRSASLNKQQASMMLPLQIHISSSSLKKIEPQCISYTSLIKSREQYQRNRLQKESRSINNAGSNRSGFANNRGEYQYQISGLVDLDEPDTILQQILTKNYKI